MNKVLQITAMANIGSIGRIAESIGNLSMSNGWESFIAYGRGAGKSSSELIRIGNSVDKYFHGIFTRLSDLHGYGSYLATKNFVRKIDDIKPDVIHLHNLHGYYINIDVLFDYLNRTGIPVVWTLHDCWTFTGHCVHFENRGCKKWVSGCYDCPDKGGYPASWMFDNSKVNYKIKKDLFNSVDNLTIVPVCKWLDKIIDKSFLRSRERKMIYNGIDTDVFKPRELSGNIHCKLEGMNGKYIVFAASSAWSPTKGLRDIVDIAGMLGNNYHIIIAGLNRCQTIGLPDNVTGIERINNTTQLAEIYSFANVFINPTYQDTLPTVNIESIACGTPVVTYNTGGCSEIIGDKTGMVVERGDLDSMKNAIEEICRNGKGRYTGICRGNAISNFCESHNLSAYIDLYNHLTEHKARVN